MSRIIAGSHGGRRITMPAGDRTRPTTDRVREALFSTLASWAGRGRHPADATLSGLSFCDLYAGSGAVGLEAASRGAAPVLLVEADRRTADLARRNATGLGLPVQLQAVRTEQLLTQTPPTAYDVVFADPPYDVPSATLDQLMGVLIRGGWLARDGLLVLERSRRTPPPVWPTGLTGSWSRSYGETVLHYASGSVEP